MIPDVIPTSRWSRGLRYTISGKDSTKYTQKIVPLSGARAKLYDPSEALELPNRLMEVATGLTTPVEFVDEYGLLGYSNPHYKNSLPLPEMGEDYPLGFLLATDPQFAKQLAESRAPAFIELAIGEPVYWFEAQARTVKLAHDLIVCAKLKDEQRLRVLIEAFSHGIYAGPDGVSERDAFDWATGYAERNLMAAVHEAIISLINPNIQGLQRKLHVDSFGQLKYSLSFTSLIQVIYWHLVGRLNSAKAPPRYCRLCGEPFFPADPRQRYCPKPLGKSRSVCGARSVKEAFKLRWPAGTSENSSRKKKRWLRKPRKKRHLRPQR
jgi:hypothetical protein